VRYVDAINGTLHQEMARDPDVLVLGLDVGALGGLYGATRGLLDRFGAARVVDLPISEAAHVGAAVGLAVEGFRPVVEIQIADFVTVAFDQLTTVAAKMHFLSPQHRVPMVVRLPYGAALGTGGYMSGAGPHHSQSMEAWLCHCAGLKVVMPSTPADAAGLLATAVRDDDPVIFMEHKGLYPLDGPDPPPGHLVPLGRAAVARAGDDVTVMATGAMVAIAAAVGDELAGEGISVEVIDVRCLVPLDRATLVERAARTGRVVIVHEAPRTGGFGAEIAAVVADEAFGSLVAPIRRVCGLDMPVPAGDGARAVLPGAASIAQAVRAALGERREPLRGRRPA